jgi:hypothetical protein
MINITANLKSSREMPIGEWETLFINVYYNSNMEWEFKKALWTDEQREAKTTNHASVIYGTEDCYYGVPNKTIMQELIKHMPGKVFHEFGLGSKIQKTDQKDVDHLRIRGIKITGRSFVTHWKTRIRNGWKQLLAHWAS